MKPKILGRDSGTDFRRWDVPEVSLSSNVDGRDPRTMTLEELENLRRQAHETGFQKGRWEGLEAGHAEIAAQVERLEQLMRALSAPLKQMDEEVEQELVQLAAAIAAQVILQEITTTPEVLLGLVGQAVTEIRDSSRSIKLHLNPDDASLLKKNLPANREEAPWDIVEDTSLSPGDLQVKAGHSIVDAGVYTRVAAIVSQSLASDGASLEKGPQKDFWSEGSP